MLQGISLSRICVAEIPCCWYSKIISLCDDHYLWNTHTHSALSMRECSLIAFPSVFQAILAVFFYSLLSIKTAWASGYLTGHVTISKTKLLNKVVKMIMHKNRHVWYRRCDYYLYNWRGDTDMEVNKIQKKL